MFTDALAAVLAGGSGKRLGGVNKSLIKVGGQTILQRQLAVLRPLFSQIVLVTNDPTPFADLNLLTFTDIFAKRGAPGGLHAALSAASCNWVFCIACDMPFIRATAIELLAKHRDHADAVVPLYQGAPEPLFAFYSKTGCLEPLTRALQEGKKTSMVSLLNQVQAKYVSGEDLEKVDPGCTSFTNVNTLQDLFGAGRSR